MRRIAFGLAVGFLLVACGGDAGKPQPQVPAAPAVTTPVPVATAEAPSEAAKQPARSLAELQKATIAAHREAMNAHDAKTLASAYADGAVVNVAGTPGEARGRDAIAAQYQRLFDAFSGFRTAPSRIWSKNDVVIVEWGWTGTHSGDLHGIAATGKPVGTMGVDVLWFTPDGLIAEQHTYYDMGTTMSQIGLSKQRARPVPTLATTASFAASSGSAEETKNVEVAARMWGAFDRKNEADFLGSTADDVVWDDMTQAETSKGKAAGKTFFEAMIKAFPDAKSSSSNSWGIADFVIAEGTFSGTHKGALFGIQPTRKAVTMHGVDILQLQGGKIVKGWSYGNSVELMMQLGLMPVGTAKGR